MKFIIDIPENVTIHEMVARGNYNWVQSQITEWFIMDSSCAGKWECSLVAPDKDWFSLAELIGESSINSFGFVARIEHLLAFGATYPDIQRTKAIYATASHAVWGDAPCYPILGGRNDGRGLFMRTGTMNMPRGYTHLTVRKVF